MVRALYTFTYHTFVPELISKSGETTVPMHEVNYFCNALLVLPESAAIAQGFLLGRRLQDYASDVLSGMLRSRVFDSLCESVVDKDPEEQILLASINRHNARERTVQYMEDWAKYHSLWGNGTQDASANRSD